MLHLDYQSRKFRRGIHKYVTFGYVQLYAYLYPSILTIIGVYKFQHNKCLEH